MARDIVREIAYVRRRSLQGLRRHTSAAQDLSRRWKDGVYDAILDYVPIKLVTILESFTRSWITEIIDAGEPYITRAAVLARSGFKIDYAMAQALVGAKITFGELVSHGLSVNSLADLDAAFRPLLDDGLFRLVDGIVDRWDTLLSTEPVLPIITNLEEVKRSISDLFEVRHILVHELPFSLVLYPAQATEWIEAVVSFTRAGDEVFSNMLYGNYPLTQQEMNREASERAAAAEEELKQVIASIDPENRDEELQSVQDAWERFRELACVWRSDLGKPSAEPMAPMLYAGEYETITRDRAKQLRLFDDREEGAL
jgi:uncharacterized protein YecT (DUF1311 family)